MKQTEQRGNTNPFTDPIIFALVMQNKDIFLDLLRRIIPEENFTEVRAADFNEELDVSIQTEAALKFAAASHGVRFDAFAKSDNTWAVVEMQTYRGSRLPKRSRYYQGHLDIEALREGCEYDDLPRSFVIFICTFDYFGEGEPIYYFQNYDIKNDLQFGDESFKIILNTTCEPGKVPKDLKPLFDYIENRPVAEDDELMGKIDADVIKYSGSEWRSKFMTFDEIRKWEREEGRKDGKLELLIELIRKGRLTIAEAAEDTGLDEATIRHCLTN